MTRKINIISLISKIFIVASLTINIFKLLDIIDFPEFYSDYEISSYVFRTIFTFIICIIVLICFYKKILITKKWIAFTFLMPVLELLITTNFNIFSSILYLPYLFLFTSTFINNRIFSLSTLLISSFIAFLLTVTCLVMAFYAPYEDFWFFSLLVLN